MELVKDDETDALELWILIEVAEENPVGQEEDLSLCGVLCLEPDGIAYVLSQRDI